MLLVTGAAAALSACLLMPPGLNLAIAVCTCCAAGYAANIGSSSSQAVVSARQLEAVVSVTVPSRHPALQPHASAPLAARAWQAHHHQTTTPAGPHLRTLVVSASCKQGDVPLLLVHVDRHVGAHTAVTFITAPGLHHCAWGAEYNGVAHNLFAMPYSCLTLGCVREP